MKRETEDRVFRQEWLCAAIGIDKPESVILMSRMLDRSWDKLGDGIIDRWIEWLNTECNGQQQCMPPTRACDCAEAIDDIKTHGFTFAAAAIGNDERAAGVMHEILNDPELLAQIRGVRRNGQAGRASKGDGTNSTGDSRS